MMAVAAATRAESAVSGEPPLISGWRVVLPGELRKFRDLCADQQGGRGARLPCAAHSVSTWRNPHIALLYNS